jgi:hypothetical protein
LDKKKEYRGLEETTNIDKATLSYGVGDMRVIKSLRQ